MICFLTERTTVSTDTGATNDNPSDNEEGGFRDHIYTPRRQLSSSGETDRARSAVANFGEVRSEGRNGPVDDRAMTGNARQQPQQAAQEDEESKLIFGQIVLMMVLLVTQLLERLMCDESVNLWSECS